MSEEAKDIKAEDITVGQLFSAGRRFNIPKFQRAYSWGEEQFEDLIDDIETALETSEAEYGENQDINKYDPYFLGSIILQEEKPGSDIYNIIDGQQRLTSLMILFATLRDIDDSSSYKKRIWTEEDPQLGIEKEPRMEVREEENSFFEEYVIEKGGTKKAQERNTEELSAPKQSMVKAIEIFRDRFTDEEGEPLTDIIQDFTLYICQKVTLVEIKAYSLSSAFKLFNITNARGLPLTNADLLKSINLGAIQDDDLKEEYARKWEKLEEEIGNEQLEMLIRFIRHIKVKDKARKSIYDEYENKVFKNERHFKGKPFFEYLFTVADIYKKKILDAKIETGNSDQEVYYHNLMNLLRNFYVSEDWMTAVIKFSEKYEDDEALYQFLIKYEKKVATDWLSGRTSTERLTQMYYIIEEIENHDDPEKVLNSETLTDYDESKLDKVEDYLRLENFYRKGNYQMPKYTLLRLDLEKRDNQHTKVAYKGK